MGMRLPMMMAILHMTHFLLVLQKPFTFYTSYVGNASKASISVEFDDDLIFDYIVSKNYTGNEYAEYMIEQNNE